MSKSIYDVVVVGCGMAGMATALRLQVKGYSTLIMEAHGQPGGCAGFFTKKGFSFDVGATTLVDFDEDGVGGKFLKTAGLEMPESEKLNYLLWLPDRTMTLYHDRKLWEHERLNELGSTPNHVAFWKFMDRLADAFWNASRNGIKLPIQNGNDIINGIRAIGIRNILLCRYINWTFLDALKKFDLQDDVALRAALAMLIEDTVHSTPEEAPLINAALGITIRGAGLRRVNGGMKSLWGCLTKRYEDAGGIIYFGNRVDEIKRSNGVYHVKSRKKNFFSRQVVSAVPVDVTFKLVEDEIKNKMMRFMDERERRSGSAVVVFLGVPEHEVANHQVTHHQLLNDFQKPLGNGNNMFISVSAPGDRLSAPEGFRAVMISTHCSTEEWKDLDEHAYEQKKERAGEHLINLARRVYPNLGRDAVVTEIGTPRTYYKYTGRIQGAVGGHKQTVWNANFGAIPHDIGVRDFRLAGDTTWPGLGTVACILGSEIVANQIMKNHKVKREM